MMFLINVYRYIKSDLAHPSVKYPLFPNPMLMYDDDFIDHRSYHEYDLIRRFEKEFLFVGFEFRELNKIQIFKNENRLICLPKTLIFYCLNRPN